MAGFIPLLLRGLVLLWTLLITALIGNVIASNINGSSSGMAAIDFTMFVAALSWVAGLVGLAAIFFTALGSPIIMLPLDGLATLFTFIDAIVLAAKLRAVDCGNISHDHLPHNWIGFGAKDTEGRCREIQASTVFMWFLWVCFSACLFFTIRTWRGGYGGSVRSSGPNMSQVGV